MIRPIDLLESSAQEKEGLGLFILGSSLLYVLHSDIGCDPEARKRRSTRRRHGLPKGSPDSSFKPHTMTEKDYQ